MPDINPPGHVSGISKPRFRLLVNGTAINGAVSCTVTSNNYYRADEWSAVVIPDTDSVWTLNAWFPQPATEAIPSTPSPPAGATLLSNGQYLLSNGTVTTLPVASSKTQPPAPMVEIQGWDDVSGAGAQSWIIGRVDKQEWNPFTGALSISGRDRTADFIEAKTSETFKNQTASQVAQTLAARHGLTAQVTATSTLVQRFYTADHDKISSDSFSRVTTEWDLLTSLAQNEGYDVFVHGTTLYFQPPTPINADAWVLRINRTTNEITANASDLTFSHNLLSKDILVRLRSWNSRQGTGFEVTAPPGVSSGSVHAGKATQYVFRRPNLQRDQAQKLANSLYADLARHEMQVVASWPYMTACTARDMLRVQGAGPGLDATYFFTEIERTLDFQGGYMEHVKACNQQPTTTASIG